VLRLQQGFAEASELTMDDSGKRENEAEKEKPPKIKAEDNPWYLLATLYGVPQSRNDGLREKNWAAWNRYFVASLDEKTRALLIEEKRHPAAELTPFSQEEVAFAKRRGSATTLTLQPPNSLVDFSNIQFDGDVDFSAYLFTRYAFLGTTFSGEANFDGATFSHGASFSGATFYGKANFASAIFFGVAGFNGATFSGKANFDRATFSSGTSFYGATFSGRAGFYGATFSSGTSFDGAIFSGVAGFDRATFFGGVGFGGATRPTLTAQPSPGWPSLTARRSPAGRTLAARLSPAWPVLVKLPLVKKAASSTRR
jgi:uncharacterized protein YjbI with pentapeptide repeats